MQWLTMRLTWLLQTSSFATDHVLAHTYPGAVLCVTGGGRIQLQDDIASISARNLRRLAIKSVMQGQRP